jgi:hypothetical protein
MKRKEAAPVGMWIVGKTHDNLLVMRNSVVDSSWITREDIHMLVGISVERQIHPPPVPNSWGNLSTTDAHYPQNSAVYPHALRCFSQTVGLPVSCI